jgi:hypothetical protein
MLGFERLPPAPCLVVANHSGTGLVEPLCMVAAWHRHFGPSRPAMGITSSIIDAVAGPLLRKVGAVPGSPSIAQAILEGKTDVLVFRAVRSTAFDRFGSIVAFDSGDGAATFDWRCGRAYPSCRSRRSGHTSRSRWDLGIWLSHGLFA